MHLIAPNFCTVSSSVLKIALSLNGFQLSDFRFGRKQYFLKQCNHGNISVVESTLSPTMSHVFFTWETFFMTILKQAEVLKRFVLLKVVSARFLLVCFLSLKESTFETWKSFYFHFKSSFRSRENQIDIQLSWGHQMPKHKTGNTTCWTTWSKHSLLMKFGQFMSGCKTRNFIEKLYKYCDHKISSRTFCVCKN